MTDVSSSKGSLTDAGMDPANYERKRARAEAQQKAQEQKTQEDINRVMEEANRKYGKAQNLEPSGMERLPQAETDIPTRPQQPELVELPTMRPVPQEHFPGGYNPELAAQRQPSQTQPNEAMRSMYGDEQKEMKEAAEQKQRELEAELREERQSASQRGFKNPIAMRLQEQQKGTRFLGMRIVPLGEGRRARAFEQRIEAGARGEVSRIREQLKKHEITGVSKPRAIFNFTKTALINQGTKDIGRGALKGLGNIGESALVERTRPQITENISFDDKTGLYEKTISKSWTERNPFSNTEYSSVTKQEFRNNKWVTTKPEIITSRRRSPITSKERQKYASNFKDVLNGANIGKELSGLRSVTRSESGGYGLGALTRLPPVTSQRQFGIERLNLNAPPQRSQPTGRRTTKKASSVPITASEMRTVTGRSGGVQISRGQPTFIRAPQPVQASPQSMPTLQAKSFGNYIPEPSAYGQSYRSQVNRWVGGRPKVVGFLNPNETPLAFNLIRAQQRMNIYTGLNPWQHVPAPFLSKQAIAEEAGLTHSAGPSHDFGNQIFNPGYGFYRLRGNGQLGNTDVFSMFMGRRPLTRPVGPIIQVTRGKGKKVKFTKIGGNA